MKIQDLDPAEATVDDYPKDLASGEREQIVAPRLMRMSEVDQEWAPTSAPAIVLKWLREFVARPNPQLGRAGSVCPFVPNSLQLDSIRITELSPEKLGLDGLCKIFSDYRDLFLATEPTGGPEALNKAFLVAFPSLSASGTSGIALLNEVESRLKRSFIEKGMMLGEFDPTNQAHGLRNPDFRPFQSPVPLLGMRHMVEADLPFMTSPSYSAEECSSYLRSYLFRLGGTLRRPKFNEAIERLIVAETAMRTSAQGVSAI
jgi:hypothetical protein